MPAGTSGTISNEHTSGDARPQSSLLIGLHREILHTLRARPRTSMDFDVVQTSVRTSVGDESLEQEKQRLAHADPFIQILSLM